MSIAAAAATAFGTVKKKTISRLLFPGVNEEEKREFFNLEKGLIKWCILKRKAFIDNTDYSIYAWI